MVISEKKIIFCDIQASIIAQFRNITSLSDTHRKEGKQSFCFDVSAP
jgi:hypothetical protein